MKIIVERLIRRARREEDGPRQEAIERFLDEAKERYGERIRRVMLYGSHATGEETAESDVDLLLV